jgi:O-glycosyl hydrolase
MQKERWRFDHTLNEPGRPRPCPRFRGGRGLLLAPALPWFGRAAASWAGAGGLAQIDLATLHQTIVGFGASSGWTSPTMDDSHADTFFTVDNGIGLSLLRMRIANGTLPATFTVWTTSDALALKQSGSLAVSSDGTFTATLPARSVTTLVSDLPGATRSASP